MKSKLKELIGLPNVWLFVKSSNGWLKNVEILDVNFDTVTFRYEHESDIENRVWEKTTRIDNIKIMKNINFVFKLIVQGKQLEIK